MGSLSLPSSWGLLLSVRSVVTNNFRFWCLAGFDLGIVIRQLLCTSDDEPVTHVYVTFVEATALLFELQQEKSVFHLHSEMLFVVRTEHHAYTAFMALVRI